jgi:Protein of unknown function (DUF962)
MPIRRNLLSWQYAGYATNHRDRVNLVIHLLTVPLFCLGALCSLLSLLGLQPWGIAIGLGLMLLAFLAQGIGHRRERNNPEPFDGASDFFSRIFVEQFISFPRYALHLLRGRR